MRIETVEKLMNVLAGLAIAGVAALVTALTVLPLKQGEGIAREEIDAESAYLSWLEDARARANGEQVRKKWEPLPGSRPPPPPARPPAPGAKQPAPEPVPEGAKQGNAERYFDPTGNIPKDERVGPYDWLRKEKGVDVYFKPEAVPRALYEKYQSWDELWNLAYNDGSGEFVDGRYRINTLNDQSYLHTKIGLQPGDQVISVNGHPVGNSVGAAQGLYQQLKNEKKFAVKVLRNGQVVVLSYYVNG